MKEWVLIKGLINEWNEWCFRPLFLTIRLYWAETTWANEMNLLWICHALAQDEPTGIFVLKTYTFTIIPISLSVSIFMISHSKPLHITWVVLHIPNTQGLMLVYEKLMRYNGCNNTRILVQVTSWFSHTFVTALFFQQINNNTEGVTDGHGSWTWGQWHLIPARFSSHWLSLSRHATNT